MSLGSSTTVRRSSRSTSQARSRSRSRSPARTRQRQPRSPPPARDRPPATPAATLGGGTAPSSAATTPDPKSSPAAAGEVAAASAQQPTQRGGWVATAVHIVDFLLGLLPAWLLAASAPFYAYHFLPVFCLASIAAVRGYLELFFNFLALDNILISIPCLFVLGYGMMHVFKILIDAFWDFLSYYSPSGRHGADFINPDARDKLVRFYRWREAHNFPLLLFDLLFALTFVTMLALTMATMRALELEPACCVAVAVAVLLQAAYMQGQLHITPMPELVSDCEYPRAQPWNHAVSTLRLIGMLAAGVASVVISNRQYFASGFLEPFLVISSGQALFYVLQRLWSDIVDGILDVNANYTALSHRIYVTSTLAGALLAAYLFRSWLAVSIFAFSFASFSHCSLLSLTSMRRDLRDAILLPHAAGDDIDLSRIQRRASLDLATGAMPPAAPSSSPPSSPAPTQPASPTLLAPMSIPPIIAQLLRVADVLTHVLLLPMLPCVVMLLLAALPAKRISTGIYALSLIVAAGGRTSLRIANYFLLLMSGRSLFWAELLRAKRRTHRRRAAARGILFSRATALGLISCVFWGLLLFTLGGMMERHLRIPSSNTYLVNELPVAPLAANTAPIRAFEFKFTVFEDDIATATFAWKDGSSTNTSHPQLQASASHALCNYRNHDIDLLEFVFFSATAYLYPRPGQRGSELTAMLLPEWEVRVPERSDDNPVVFVEFNHRQRPLTVVAVSGTKVLSVYDWVTDIDIWFEPAFFHFSTAILPGLQLWPDTPLTKVLAGIARIQSALKPGSTLFGHKPRYYHQPVVEHIRRLQAANRTVVVTGHSLGGGLAKIAGALTGVQAVSFSAPGIYEIRRKWSISREDIFRLITNVNPANDLVAKLAQPSGTVLHYDCPHDLIQCHYPLFAPCELLRLCPHMRPQLSCNFHLGEHKFSPYERVKIMT